MAKGKYGVTPWGAWFIDVLDGYSMGARLDRGRSYANTGKVLALELTEGKAVAKVAGNYKPFYRVTIEFPPLKEAETVYRLIEADPVLLAHIARGELPETFLQKLRKAGIDLIPRRWRDMRRSCTCPDYGDPCKHMAALYYIIAREIDADPAVLFRLRGMDLAERFGKATVREIPPPFVVSAAPSAPTAGRKKAGAKAGKKALVQKGGEGEPDTTAQDAAEPDTAALVETALGELPDCHGLITSLLPSDPPFCDRNFAFSLAEFYHRCAAGEVWVDADGGNYFETGETVEHRFSRSHWALRCDKEAGPGVLPVLEETNVRGQTYNHSIYDVWWQFSTFSGGAETTGTSAYTFLFCLFKFIGLLLRASAFIPYVLHQNGSLRIIWRPYDAIPPVARALEALSRLETGLLPLSGTTRASGRSVVDLVSSAILNEWVRRRWFSRRCPQGSQDFRRLLAVFFAGEPLPVDTPDQRSLPLAIDRWLSVLHVDFAKYRYSFTVKPIKSGVQGGGSLPPVPVLHSGRNVRASPATPPSVWPSTSPSAGLCPATPRWGVENPPDPPLLDEQDFALSIDVLGRNKDERAIKTPLYKIAANKKSGLVQEEAQAILRPLTALSNYLPEIRSLMKHKSVELSSERLTAFLESAAPLLSQLGITVTLPKSLRKELKPRLVLQTTGKDKGRVVSYLDLDSILHWKWQIAIGERILDAEEFTKLIKEKRALVRFRDGFVKIDPSEFAALLKKAGKPPPDSLGFLKAHLEGDSILSFDAEAVIRRLFEERHFEAPPALSANLRPYQLRGYNWACSLLMAGFGCVLADDMGLGKTVQAIAVLLRLREEGLLADGCLVVAPAALLANWENELARFAPALCCDRYHGTGRALKREKHQVFLTTYQTAVRDSEKLENEVFSLLIVDEAHLMKNAETRMACAIKKLRPRFRLALSGTPVENRLEDLRSLFDFILPGYLGTQADFKKEYRHPIEALRSREKAASLRKITAPFLMRRLKTDKAIISDLPEKITSCEYAALEKEQAALYESIVSETMKKLETMESTERSALIFSLLTSLKQVCDHPRVYDKESPADSALSGKARLLLTLLDEIIAGGEKVLIFSQYVEALDCLNSIITAELGEAPLLYHGGLSQKNRTAVIERFQTDGAARILLVSLKAGGLGLNLTAASRVIHYDLWYNPAVESQATDRAFRIGQKRTVFVHRLITKNTFEEKIDAMITSKKELAGMTVASGESWLARMSREELTALFGR